MRRSVNTFISALIVVGFSLAASNTALAKQSALFTPVSPTQEHNEVISDIAEKLEDYHFSRIKLNDQLSAQIFNKYVEILDGSKYYLYQSDVDEFSAHKEKLDDYIEDGENKVAFDLYNRYQKRAVDRLQFAIDFLENKTDTLDYTKKEEFVVDREAATRPNNKAEFDDVWRKRIKNDLLKLKLAGKAPKEANEFLLKRYKRQLDLIGKAKADDAFSLWASAVTLSFDPHSTYFSPADMENFNISMRLSLQGIGAVLTSDGEYTKVVKLIQGGPAQKSKALKAADRIIGVGQDDEEMVDVIGWRLSDVVQLIRGEKGSKVRLRLLPQGLDEKFAKEVTLIREKIKLEEQAASKEIIEHEIHGKKLKLGVIVLPSFYMDFDAYRRGDPDFRSTTRDVAKLIHELKQENIDGLIIDLRNNGGGSLSEVNLLTGLFIKHGPTVQVKSLSRTQPYKDRDPSVHWSGPLAVLVNRFSASASEIFAGAIQDYGRGVIIGERTFGKGTVQNITELNYGMLKYTNAKFYRISGDSTQHRGVVPDIRFPHMVDHDLIGESASKNALPWDTIKPLSYRKLNAISPLLDFLITRHEARKQTDPFFNILEEQSALNNAITNQQNVTLNESERKALNDKLEKQKLTLENKRRALDGLPPLDSVALVNYDDEPEKEDDDENEATDVFLQESLNIMADLIELSSNNRLSHNK